MRKLLIACVSLLTSVAYGQGNLNYSNYVNDFAGVLDESEEYQLNEKMKAFDDKTDVEFAIVTVSSLEGRDVESFTNDLFNKWGVGKQGKNNGLMILIAPNEREWRIEVGYGLEEYITDGYSKVEAEKVFPDHFRNNDYFGGIDPIVDKFQDRIGTMSWPEREAEMEKKKRDQEAAAERVKTVFMWIGIIILMLIGVGVIVAVMIRKKRKERELKEKIDRHNKENIELAFNFRSKIKQVLGFEPSRSVKAWEDVASVLDGLVIRPKKDLDSAVELKFDMLGMCEGHLKEMNRIIANYEKLAELKSYVSSDKFGSRASSIRAEMNAFVAKNNASEYRVGWSREDNVESSIKNAEIHYYTMKTLLSIETLSELTMNYNKCMQFLDAAASYISEGKSSLSNYESARSYIDKNYGTIPDLISRMRSKCNNSDVSSSTKSKANNAEANAKAYKPKTSKLDVLSSSEQLRAVIEELSSVTRKAQSDIDEEERRRRRKREEEEEARRRRMSSSSSSSYGGGFGGGGSFGGGGFGGFGGGRSGGGGSSGKW